MRSRKVWPPWNVSIRYWRRRRISMIRNIRRRSPWKRKSVIKMSGLNIRKLGSWKESIWISGKEQPWLWSVNPVRAKVPWWIYCLAFMMWIKGIFVLMIRISVRPPFSILGDWWEMSIKRLSCLTIPSSTISLLEWKELRWNRWRKPPASLTLTILS